jgi:small-conductance mechanosensitive channel
MHPMLAAMTGRDFARFLRAFLPTARHAWFNYAAVFGMIVAPIVALVALGGDPSSAPFVLTAIGLVLTVAGPLLVSNRLAEPKL